MNVQLHIERLVVDEGLMGSGGYEALQAAVIAELMQMLAAGGLRNEWLAGGAVPLVQGGEIASASNQTRGPSEWGAQIGQAVYAGLGDSVQK